MFVGHVFVMKIPVLGARVLMVLVFLCSAVHWSSACLCYDAEKFRLQLQEHPDLCRETCGDAASPAASAALFTLLSCSPQVC